MKKNPVFIPILTILGIATIFFLYIGMNKHADYNPTLVSIWETADGNINRTLTPADIERLKNSRPNTTDEDSDDTADFSPPADTQTFTDIEIANFLNKSVSPILNLSPENFEQTQKSSAGFFTKRGFVSFYEALEKSQIRQLLEKKRSTLKAELVCIIGTNSDQDEYNRPIWVAQTIVQYKYRSKQETKSEYQLTEITLMNKVDESPQYQSGLAIRKWFTKNSISEAEAKDQCKGSRRITNSGI